MCLYVDVATGKSSKTYTSVHGAVGPLLCCLFRATELLKNSFRSTLVICGIAQLSQQERDTEGSSTIDLRV